MPFQTGSVWLVYHSSKDAQSWDLVSPLQMDVLGKLLQDKCHGGVLGSLLPSLLSPSHTNSEESWSVISV